MRLLSWPCTPGVSPACPAPVTLRPAHCALPGWQPTVPQDFLHSPPLPAAGENINKQFLSPGQLASPCRDREPCTPHTGRSGAVAGRSMQLLLLLLLLVLLQRNEARSPLARSGRQVLRATRLLLRAPAINKQFG